MRHYGSMGGRVLLAVVLCLALVFAASCAKPSITKTAEGIVDSMAKGDFKAASADFDATVAAQMPAEKLGQVWASLPPQVGADGFDLVEVGAGDVGGGIVFAVDLC